MRPRGRPNAIRASALHRWGHRRRLRVFLDGELVAGSLPVRFKPDDPPHTERFGLYAAPTLFEQNAPSTHTLSVDTAGYCGTEADPTGPPPRIRAVRIDVIETR